MKPLSFSMGFSLTEMSIAMILMGTVAGTTLNFSEIKKVAQVKAIASQIAAFDTAALVFYDKYGHLPGDIANRSYASYSSIFNTPGFANIKCGDNNELIESKNDLLSCEQTLFFNHLSALKMVKGSFNGQYNSVEVSTNIPEIIGSYAGLTISSASSYSRFFDATDYGNYYLLGINNNSDSNKLELEPDLTTQQSYALDKMLDDGFPESGSIQHIQTNHLNNCAEKNDDHIVYKLSSSTLKCALKSKSTF